jgi:hypothetical protein
MTCNPHSVEGHGYIVVAMDCFTKWAEAMHTFDNTKKNVVLFIFIHNITRFGVCQSIITNHGSHFRNFVMFELTEKLDLQHEKSTPIINRLVARLKQLKMFSLLCFDGW